MSGNTSIGDLEEAEEASLMNKELQYDIDHLKKRSHLKTFNPNKIYDWSRYRIYSHLQMPTHPSYGKE